MDSSTSMEDSTPTFYVGQHESKRSLPVTDQVLRQAQNCNYDMLTTPITTPYFHNRVLSLLSTHLSELSSNPADIRNGQPPSPTIPSLSLVDTPLTPGHIISQLLAFASPWIDLSSPDPLIYNISRQVLNMEIAYAAFCGVGNVIIQGPKLHHGSMHGEGVTQYAHAIQEALSIASYIQIQIMLPMVDNPSADGNDEMGSFAPFARDEYIETTVDEKLKKADVYGTWDAWNIIRTVCKYNTRLFVALLLPRHLPPLPVQSRWHSEPLRFLALNSETFLKNNASYPVLARTHQSLINRYMRLKTPPWIMLCDVGPIPGLDNPNMIVDMADGFISPNAAADAPSSPTPAESFHHQQANSKKIKETTPHLNYIRNLQRKQPPRTTVERYGDGYYQDFLQAPLQPLTDNLESITYEVFEKDPIKYDRYEKAVTRALSDWAKYEKPKSSPDGRIVVAVAGAGRGPLVTRALRASEAAGVDVELWAVEKNPNAYVLLQHHNVNDWSNRVNIIQSDMRSWKGPWHETSQPPSKAPHKIDILISELLGSFADNELSPECLDGVLHLLNPTCGISIPHSYTAHLTPIAAPKLHADISARAHNDSSASETPYVVMLHAIDYLSTYSPPPPSASPNKSGNESEKQNPLSPLPNILPAWSFTHTPLPSIPATNTHNTRQARLTFRTRDRGACHGLAGYFEAILYPATDSDPAVELSTNPLTMESKSAGMISWFPIFFPLKTPLYLPDNSELALTMYRRTDQRKVWYEWMVETYGWCFNLGAKEQRRVRLGVSEVGSSKSGGCMM